jgi:hypothetical protein
MSNTTANPKHKDSFFTKLFSEPQNALKLYNAISKSEYPLDTPIEMTTLENVLFVDRYNDLSFVIDDKLVVLIERQSTICPNMCLRLFGYLSKVYDRFIMHRDIYSTRMLKIPRPEFIVLYNGTAPYPDESILRLSEAFRDLPAGYEPNGGLELTAKVLNINKGHNIDTVQKSVELDGYAQIVDQIRNNKNSGMSLEGAIKKAVQDCIESNILSDFLKKYGGDVMSFLYAEMSVEDFVAIRVEDAKYDNAVKAAKKGLAKGFSVEDVAEINDLSIAEVQVLADE